MKDVLKKIVGIVFCLFILFMVTGCSSKSPITTSEFKSKMEVHGYVVSDKKSEMLDYDYIDEVYVANSSDSTHFIEFYVLSDDRYATSFFEIKKSEFEKFEGSASSQVTVDLNDYTKYEVTVNNQYKLVSKIDNTVLYFDIPSSSKKIVKDIVKELGY